MNEWFATLGLRRYELHSAVKNRGCSSRLIRRNSYYFFTQAHHVFLKATYATHTLFSKKATAQPPTTATMTNGDDDNQPGWREGKPRGIARISTDVDSTVAPGRSTIAAGAEEERRRGSCSERRRGGVLSGRGCYVGIGTSLRRFG